jgi:integrase
MALTELSIRKLKAPTSSRREHYDGLIPGLGVRITDKGTKTFIYVYSFNGRRRRFTIGRVGEIALEDAREKARELRALVRQGRDPAAERKTSRALRTPAASQGFSEIIELYDRRDLQQNRRGWEVKRIIDRELIPHWGDRQLTAIARADVLERIEALLDAKKPEAARRLFEVTRRFFNWAIARGIYGIDQSPCKQLQPKDIIGEKRLRTRVLRDDEMRALWRAAERLGYPFGPLVHLLMLTGQRRNEVAEASWCEIEIDKALWTIPVERMKAAAAHVVPLSAKALSILKCLPRFTNDFVFTSGDGGKPISGFSKMKNRLDGLVLAELLKLAEDSGEDPSKVALQNFTLHDIRRTMRTHLSALPVPELVRELVIAHTKPGLHKVYDQHAYLDEKRQALGLWAARLKTIVEGCSAPADNVVALRAS